MRILIIFIFYSNAILLSQPRYIFVQDNRPCDGCFPPELLIRDTNNISFDSIRNALPEPLSFYGVWYFNNSDFELFAELIKNKTEVTKADFSAQSFQFVFCDEELNVIEIRSIPDGILTRCFFEELLKYPLIKTSSPLKEYLKHLVHLYD
jgi:hypothetical protein